MDRDRVGYGVGVVLAGTATAGTLALAAYLLFTEVTTFPGTTQPATGLESGNIFLFLEAVVPVVLSGLGLVGVYRHREWLPILVAPPILLVGISGFGVGFSHLIVGVLLLASAAAASFSVHENRELKRPPSGL